MLKQPNAVYKWIIQSTKSIVCIVQAFRVGIQKSAFILYLPARNQSWLAMSTEAAKTRTPPAIHSLKMMADFGFLSHPQR